MVKYNIILITCILLLIGKPASAQIFHIKGVKTVGLAYTHSKYGWGSSLVLARYISNEIHLSAELNYENSKPSKNGKIPHTTIEEALGLFSLNYCLLKYKGIYLNAKGGLFLGAETLSEKVKDHSESHFAFGSHIGVKTEFWQINKLGFHIGFDQLFKIAGVNYGEEGKSKPGHRWYYTIGVNYQID